MKAAIFYKCGTPKVIQIGEVDLPKHSSDQIVIDVKSFSLNYVDLYTRRGPPNSNFSFPHVGGTDASGVIKEVGKNFNRLYSPGDRILVNPGFSCFKCRYCRRGEQSMCETFKIFGTGNVWGGSAEQTIVPGSSIMKIPNELSFTDAAASPLTFITSYRMLKTKADVKEGETVLVTGAGGGIGTTSIQMAKRLGAEVFALTSKNKVEKVKKLGADHVLDYSSDSNWDETLLHISETGVDVIIDPVGEATWQKNIRVLGKGGRLVTCGANAGSNGKTEIRSIYAKQAKILGSYMGSNSDFDSAMSLLFKNHVKPVIDSIRPIENIISAHELLESGNQFGKIVLTV